MRFETTATSISWIPSEAVKGMTKLPFEMGVAHYDETPPEHLGSGDLEALRGADRFRFANQLTAWIEVEDGEITDWGREGSGLIGSTTMRLGKRDATFGAVALPDLAPEPEVGEGTVRFTQTAGGRTGVPTPRRVSRPPFVQVSAPLAWTTLVVTMRADGQSEVRLTGASPFPRHWLYGDGGELIAKSGLIDFRTWYRTAFGKHSPWGDEDTPALVTAVGSALERALADQLMRGGAPPSIEKLKAGHSLVTQGDEGTDLFLLLDGVLIVDVDGRPVAELGPGALIGERALLEGARGRRHSVPSRRAPWHAPRPHRSTAMRSAVWPTTIGGRTSVGKVHRVLWTDESRASRCPRVDPRTG